MNLDMFTPIPVQVAREHSEHFTQEFLNYLPENIHVYQAFEQEARKVLQKGYKHYSARTIIEVLRHHTALSDSSKWKLNDHATPYFSRLFALLNPASAGLFEFRKASGRVK